MKITGITTHGINMPLKLDGDVSHVGGQGRTALEMLLVPVDTDASVTGWGGASATASGLRRARRYTKSSRPSASAATAPRSMRS